MSIPIKDSRGRGIVCPFFDESEMTGDDDGRINEGQGQGKGISVSSYLR